MFNNTLRMKVESDGQPFPSDDFHDADRDVPAEFADSLDLDLPSLKSIHDAGGDQWTLASDICMDECSKFIGPPKDELARDLSEQKEITMSHLIDYDSADDNEEAEDGEPLEEADCGKKENDGKVDNPPNRLLRLLYSFSSRNY